MGRRLAAILAADVAGFSALIGADEEGTLEAQRRHRAELIDPLLAKYAGRVANTAGDSLLIEFPSAVDAVRMAVATQDEMRERNASVREVREDRRIEYRMGINLGDVVAEKQDLLGNGVNVAARLQALAPPGGIILSRSVRDQVRDRMKLTLADLGEVRVKNIARPIRAFQLLREGEAPVSVPGRRSFGLRWVTAAGVIISGLIGGTMWWQAERIDFEPADPNDVAFALSTEPSVAVLPFETLSSEENAKYLSDGITESITSTLTQSPDLMVIASDSAKAFGGDPPPIKQIAEQLGVRYLLKGSVQTSGQRLRVMSQLLDAVAGQHLLCASSG